MPLYQNAFPRTLKPGAVIVHQSYFTTELLPNWPEFGGWHPSDIEHAPAGQNYEAITTIREIVCRISVGIQPPRKILVGGYLGNNHPLHTLMSRLGYEIRMKTGWRSVLEPGLLRRISGEAGYLVYVGSLGHNLHYRIKTFQNLARLAWNGIKIIHATHRKLLQKELRENDRAILDLIRLIKYTYGEVYLLDSGESLSRCDLTAYH